MAPTSPESKIIEARAYFFEKVRTFFKDRAILEVDVPALSSAASIDAHIDPMKIDGQDAYLHTSPEYGMKKLLSAHKRDIYQMSHVFRANEQSPLHSPEFTMIEWYRCNTTLPIFIDETLELTRLFLGPRPATLLTYQDAFLKHTPLDPLSGDPLPLARRHNLSPSALASDRQTLLQILFSLLIEPKLQDLTVITDFPAEQAALARLSSPTTAARFEIYFRGIELANGFHELADPVEQKRRLLLENDKRRALHKAPLPLDNTFLAALEAGLPDCCGVAAGFDRLLMLHLGLPHLPIILKN